jgi:hypothetical protein
LEKVLAQGWKTFRAAAVAGFPMCVVLFSNDRRMQRSPLIIDW